ncbi:hypothetical protein [Mucilaginibacter polytrichastri]|uniref:Outer membrane protein beta-barrel domain-containing protein n=1 Tax=Mucilaginibacter polytrichastri TaxID=1302689 RepID=A0A1Q5ZUA6_9SPHI|nr:hypothetical protein [Mucilaginibacter polytrichastri]OKS85362.1 hypothetical protein RG47T_0807 [Mucilaginibacter polytrichastri]SFS40102.1 hypothetical protein SAMN04487890_101286 [Mucilaginibacter polytrichastri]
MKKLFNLLILGIGFCGVANAQSTTTDDGKGWFSNNIAGAAQVQVTYRNTNLDQVNRILNNNNIPSLKGNDVWINLSMSHVHKQWIFEDGLGVTPLSTSEGTNNIKAKYGQGQAYFRAGYNIAKSDDSRFFPFVGLNFSAAMLKIEDKGRQESTNDFSQELLTSTSSKTLYQGNFGIELGAGYDYLIKLKTKKIDNCVEVQRNIPIGIRAGYYINAARSDWKIDGHSLDNSPDKNQSAVFISLNIGLGYNVRKL